MSICDLSKYATCSEFFLSGDVDFSAEDKPPYFMLHTHTNTRTISLSASGFHPSSSSAQPQSSSDQGPVVYVEEEHQSFLERHTSLRFLLAGGIAGAGVYLNPWLKLRIHGHLISFADMHGSVRSTQSILDYAII